MSDKFTPSEKSEAISEFLDNVSDRRRKVRAGQCVCCNANVEAVGTVTHGAITFRDKLSEKEYTISGLCQKCQDEVFGAPPQD